MGEVLDLLDELNEHEGRTIVLVLHDLNQACRYAHHVVAMRDGEVLPEEAVDAAMVEAVFAIRAEVVPDPVTGAPLCVPLGRRGRGRRASVPCSCPELSEDPAAAAPTRSI